MRAKFRVEHVKHYSESEEAVMHAVYGGSPENNQFSVATPSGELRMHINNPAALDLLKPGKEYYLDFTEAPE